MQPGKNLLLYGRLYNAQKELTDASNQGSTEALLVLGMVYGAQSDTQMPGQCTSSTSIRKLDDTSGDQTQTAAQGYNGLAVCDMQKEIMILLWKISAAEFPLLPMMKCRACYLMKL